MRCAGFAAADWSKPTDCTRWDVRALCRPRRRVCGRTGFTP